VFRNVRREVRQFNLILIRLTAGHPPRHGSDSPNALCSSG
jgi:hypothetical protein